MLGIPIALFFSNAISTAARTRRPTISSAIGICSTPIPAPLKHIVFITITYSLRSLNQPKPLPVLHFVRFTRFSPLSSRRRERLPKTREPQNDGRIPVIRHAGHGLTTQRTMPRRYRQSPHGGDAKRCSICKTFIKDTSHKCAVIHSYPFFCSHYTKSLRSEVACHATSSNSLLSL